MRIFEISNANLVWARFHDINLDIDTKYMNAVDLLNTLIRLRSKRRTQVWTYTIEGYEYAISSVLSDNFPDNDDSDIVDLKVKAEKMIVEINKLKSQLV